MGCRRIALEEGRLVHGPEEDETWQ
jgi:hypothetical protein